MTFRALNGTLCPHWAHTYYAVVIVAELSFVFNKSCCTTIMLISCKFSALGIIIRYQGHQILLAYFK